MKFMHVFTKVEIKLCKEFVFDGTCVPVEDLFY
jgi:hypothetical protein